MKCLPDDSVPSTFEEAIALVISCMDESDKAALKAQPTLLEESHFHFGMHLRNQFSLWHDTPLTRNIKSKWGVCHGDDLSGLICDAVACDIIGVPRNTNALAEHYKEHWRSLGVDPVTNTKL